VPERADLYPMLVTVEIDGQLREPLRVESSGMAVGLYPLAPSPSPTVEVRLIPERWGVVRRENLSILASFQLLAIEGVER